MEGLLVIFVDELEMFVCNREVFKLVLFLGDGEERVLLFFCMGGVKLIRIFLLVFFVDRLIVFVF